MTRALMGAHTPCRGWTRRRPHGGWTTEATRAPRGPISARRPPSGPGRRIARSPHKQRKEDTTMIPTSMLAFDSAVLIIAVLVLALGLRTVRIVPQARVRIIQRL